MIKKALVAFALLLLPVTGACAQTSAQAVNGFLLAQGSTYNGYTCPAAATMPCFVQYGSSLPVTGTFSASLAGFQPSSSTANSTISVTASNTSTALPANGGDVIVSNKGSSTIYFNLTTGAGTASVTTSIPLVAGAAVGQHLPAGATYINTIADTSNTSTVVVSGGTGLVTGYGGGSSSSGGGAVTVANGADVTQGAIADAAVVNPASSASVVSLLKGLLTQLVTPVLPSGASTAANQTSVIGTKAAGTAASNSLLTGCVYNTSLPTLTNGQQAAAQCDSSGRPLVTVSGAGDASAANQTVVQGVIGAATAPTKMNVVGGVYNSSAPTLTNGQSAAAQFDASGNLKINVAAGNGSVDGTSKTSLAYSGIGAVAETTATACTTDTQCYASLNPADRSLRVNVMPNTVGGTTAYGLQSAASTNSTNVKASAGVVTAMNLLNTTTTIYYLRMYNASSAPTCSSATNFVRTWPIPPAAAAGGAGGIAVNLGAYGSAFSTGISFCLTGGPSSTDNTSAATGVFVNMDYK